MKSKKCEHIETAVGMIPSAKGISVTAVIVVGNLIRVSLENKISTNGSETIVISHKNYWITDDDKVVGYKQAFIINAAGEIRKQGQDQIKLMLAVGIERFTIARSLGISSRIVAAFAQA